MKVLLRFILRSFFVAWRNKQIAYNQKSSAEIVINWNQQKVSCSDRVRPISMFEY